MVPRDLLTAPRCAPSYKPHVSEWSEIRLWMREPISLSPEVFLARNPRQNLLRFFWPEPAKPAQKRVTADSTLLGAACKEGDCDAVTVRGRVFQTFVARYWQSGLQVWVETGRGTCRKFCDPFAWVHLTPRCGPQILLT
jgi:hypothetical protein